MIMYTMNINGNGLLGYVGVFNICINTCNGLYACVQMIVGNTNDYYRTPS